MTGRTFICRCEDVTVKDCDAAIDAGLDTIEEIKRFTGMGTGPCQGQECMVPLCLLLRARGIADGATLQPFTARPPTAQISLGALADGHARATKTTEADDSTEDP
ncbi:MAG: (2Fe-2S)-binding protein [Nannocystaceae bacterium]